MNKITHEGNEYEVLSPDRISEITHARLAGGKVVDAKFAKGSNPVYDCIAFDIDGWTEKVYKSSLYDLGMQPLKLLERKPVEFTDTFAQCVDGKWYPVYSLDDGFGYQRCEQKVFRCVEVTE